MANRHKPVVAVGLLSLIWIATGCHGNGGAAADAYPQPRFDAPRQAVVPVTPPPSAVAAAAPVRKQAIAPVVITSPPPRYSSSTFAGSPVPAAWTPPVAARPWRWIVIHHSDTETGGMAAIDRMHKRQGWDGVGYDFVIGNGTDTADGQIEPTFRWTGQKIGAHAKTPDNKYNEFGIGICLVGNMMDHPPTARQMAAVERLTAYMMATYHISPDHVLGHGNTKNTDCPGRYTDLATIRAAAGRLCGTRLLADASRPGAGTELLVGNVGRTR